MNEPNETIVEDELTEKPDEEVVEVADDSVSEHEAAERAEDRLFSVVAIGLMVLLLICVALVVIADRRPPAGL